MGLFGKSTSTPATATTQGTGGADLKCSFCGKSQREVKKLVAGPATYICDECIYLSVDIIEEKTSPPPMPDAAALLAGFDERATGQLTAKRALTAALRQHYHRAHHPDERTPVPRVLLVGSRGVGKTTLGRALCAVAGVPAYHGDVSRLSESGYVGEDVENFIAGLIDVAKSSPALANVGVLFLDGLEKLAKRHPLGVARDISGESVQRELLRLLDGLPLSIPTNPRRHPQDPGTRFQANRLLVAGAISIADGAVPAGASDRALRDALIEAGMLPELLARFDVLVPLERLAYHELSEIFEGPRGLLTAARTMVRALGGDLEFSGAAVREVVTAAQRDADGAWALSRPLQRYLREVLTERSVTGTWRVDESKARALLDVR